ncbi:MAG: thiamine pyrophosphate-binding protein [Kiloniellales bacterium]|nr:thiamine pyrophosphate-binding protein [Kiloniellales bacterium]
MMEQNGHDWPGEIFRQLLAAEIRQVATLPDGGHKELIALCTAEPLMTLVPLTTEEEGVALLAGAWLGGQRGVLLMQSSGVGNCINMLSLAKTCRFPLLMLVTMRGQSGEFNPWQLPMGQTASPALELAGCLVIRLEDAADTGDTIAAAARMTFRSEAATAVLISQRLIGAKAFTE